MAKSNRMEKIRQVRSLNDLLKVIQEIREESENDGKVAQKLFSSLSAARKDETIVIRHSPAGKVSKVKTSGKPAKLNFTGKVSSFKAPPKAEIEKHNAVLQRLYENAKELDAVESMLRQQFSGVKAQREALSGVVALKKNVDTSIQTALTALNNVATKHFPTEMQEMRDVLTGFLIDNVPENQYDDIGFLEYVALGDKNSITFSVYVEIENLKNSNGYVFDEYFIILTGVVDAKGNIAYFINALPDFKVPGKYPLGKQIASESQMEQRVSQLLAHNDIITDLERAPMPMHDDKDAHDRGFSAIKGVLSAKVADDALYLEVGRANAQQKQAIVKETQNLLNQVMRRKKDASVSHKAVTKEGKHYLKFILYFKPGAAPQNLNLAKLSEMANVLDLSDAQMRKLRNAIID